MRREKIQREYQIVRVDGIPAYYVFLVSIFLLVSLVVTKQERVFHISIYRDRNRFVALAQCKSGLPVKGGPGLKTPDATISALALKAPGRTLLRAHTLKVCEAFGWCNRASLIHGKPIVTDRTGTYSFDCPPR